MIELIDGLPDNVIAVDCTGRITRIDYERVLIPAAGKVLAKHPKARLYYRARPSRS